MAERPKKSTIMYGNNPVTNLQTTRTDKPPDKPPEPPRKDTPAYNSAISMSTLPLPADTKPKTNRIAIPRIKPPEQTHITFQEGDVLLNKGMLEGLHIIISGSVAEEYEFVTQSDEDVTISEWRENRRLGPQQLIGAPFLQASAPYSPFQYRAVENCTTIYFDSASLAKVSTHPDLQARLLQNWISCAQAAGAEIIDFMREQDAMKMEIAKLTAEKTKFEDRARKAEDTLAESEHTAENLQHLIEVLSNKNKKLNANNEELSSENHDLKARLESYARKILVAARTTAEQAHKITNLEGVVISLAKQLTKPQSTPSAEHAVINALVARVEEKIDQGVKQIAQEVRSKHDQTIGILTEILINLNRLPHESIAQIISVLKSNPDPKARLFGRALELCLHRSPPTSPS